MGLLVMRALRIYSLNNCPVHDTAVVIVALLLWVTCLVLVYEQMEVCPLGPPSSGSALLPSLILRTQLIPGVNALSHFMEETLGWGSWRWNVSSKLAFLQFSVGPGVWVNLLVWQRCISWFLLFPEWEGILWNTVPAPRSFLNLSLDS